jgi:hypothetical protein
VRVKVPQQTNLEDCGVFVLFFAQEFLFRPEEFIRKATSREMSEDDWNVDPTKLRMDIYSILQTRVTETAAKKDDGITNDMVEMSDDETEMNGDAEKVT